MASGAYRLRPLFSLWVHPCRSACARQSMNAVRYMSTAVPDPSVKPIVLPAGKGSFWNNSSIGNELLNASQNADGLVYIYSMSLTKGRLSRNYEPCALWMNCAADIMLRDSKAKPNKRISSKSLEGLRNGFEKLVVRFAASSKEKFLENGGLVLTLTQAIVTYQTACIKLDLQPNYHLKPLLNHLYGCVMNPKICNSYAPGLANRIVQFASMHQDVCDRSEKAANVQHYLDSVLIRLFMSSESHYISIAALSALRKSAKTPEKWLEIVETRLNSIASELKQFELANLIETMAQKSIRNPALLRSVCQIMASEEKHVEPFAIKRITSIISACRSLTFHDQTLFMTLSADIMSQLPLTSTPKHVTALLTEMSLWNWAPSSVLQKTLRWIDYNFHSFAAHELATAVAAFGRMNFIPEDTKLLVKMRNEILKKDEGYPLAPVLRLEFSMACAILGILNEEVVNKFVINSDATQDNDEVEASSHRTVVSWIKKLNILSIARLDLQMEIDDLMQSLSNQIESQKFTSFFTTGKVAAEKQLSLMRAIGPLAPPDTHMKRARVLPQGVYLDCELRLDGGGHVMPVKDWTDDNDDLSKVAVIVRTYHDYCQTRDDSLTQTQSLCLTGSNALAKKIMHLLRYKVVEINIQDLDPRKKLTDRVALIDSKIKSVLKIAENQLEQDTY